MNPRHLSRRELLTGGMALAGSAVLASAAIAQPAPAGAPPMLTATEPRHAHEYRAKQRR